MEEGVRIDKWLWAVRIFKTRNLATNACRASKVKIMDHAVKPSHIVKPGETLTINLSLLVKTIRVLGLTENRVSAKLAVNFAEDLTPAEEYNKLHGTKETGFEHRPRGSGRPTKRERRAIEQLKRYPRI